MWTCSSLGMSSLIFSINCLMTFPVFPEVLIREALKKKYQRVQSALNGYRYVIGGIPQRFYLIEFLGFIQWA